jgi:hypothetical protein
MNQNSEELIVRLLAWLKKSPVGDLPLAYRKRLWSTITEGTSDEEKKITLTQLDSLCVRHAEFIWAEKFGNTHDIDRILSIAQDTATDNITKKTALDIRDDFYVDVVENQEYEQKEYPVMFVGHAAANTIATATDDFVYDPTDRRTDIELDPDAFEPSFLVASALAGGMEEDGDVMLRREFWEWYLSIAVYSIY